MNTVDKLFSDFQKELILKKFQEHKRQNKELKVIIIKLASHIADLEQSIINNK